MNNQLVIVCPGIHDVELTQEFIAGLSNIQANNWQFLVFPTQDYPAYSAIHIVDFLRSQINNIKQPIALISFSAGVVGAIGAASSWQLLGGNVKTLIAIDGWGVPLAGNFPIHRLSHDYFTHWSSALLGAGDDSFYADPAVEHLELWQSPDSCNGWCMQQNMMGKLERRYMIAAEFIIYLLQKYRE
jgi:hypothetical protein